MDGLTAEYLMNKYTQIVGNEVRFIAKTSTYRFYKLFDGRDKAKLHALYFADVLRSIILEESQLLNGGREGDC